MKKYKCPHCGEETFTIRMKAFAGSFSSDGKVCPACHRHAVNGMPSTVFRTVVWLAAFIGMLALYFGRIGDNDYSRMVWFPVIFAAAFVLPYIFDAFFGPLVPALTARNSNRKS